MATSFVATNATCLIHCPRLPFDRMRSDLIVQLIILRNRVDIQSAGIPIGSINCTIWITEPNPTEVLFGVDAFAEGHVSRSDSHNSTTSNSLTSQHCATFLIEFVQCLARHLYVQLVFELDRRLRKQQENIMTSFKVVALALLSATSSTPAKRRGDSPDGPRPVPN
jgi:hypothetical protein